MARRTRPRLSLRRVIWGNAIGEPKDIGRVPFLLEILAVDLLKGLVAPGVVDVDREVTIARRRGQLIAQLLNVFFQSLSESLESSGHTSSKSSESISSDTKSS